MARPVRAGAAVTGDGWSAAVTVGSLVLFVTLIGACVRLAGEWLVDRRWSRAAAAFAAAGGLFWLGVVVLRARTGFPA